MVVAHKDDQEQKNAMYDWIVQGMAVWTKKRNEWYECPHMQCTIQCNFVNQIGTKQRTKYMIW